MNDYEKAESANLHMAIEEAVDDLERFWTGRLSSLEEDYEKMEQNYKDEIEAYKSYIEDLKGDIEWYKNQLENKSIL